MQKSTCYRAAVISITLLLQSISVFASVETTDAEGIKYGVINEVSKEASVLGYTKDSESVKIPASIVIDDEEYMVTEIGDQAFENCYTLKEIELPSTLQTIRYMAFGHCGSLIRISMPESVTTIENWAFEACTSLKEVEFSPSLKFIGYHAFDNCTAIEEITLPDSLEEISTYAFNECEALSSVVLPKGIQAINQSTFFECKALTYIPLPEGLLKLDHGAFGYCTSLKEITLPKSLQSIETGVFDSCNSLEAIYSLATTPPTTYSSAFNRLDFNSIDVYVPGESRYTYSLYNGWNRFPDFIAIKSIEGNEYSLTVGNTQLLEATIPAFVSDIKWESSQPEIATIEANGLLTAKDAGVCQISLTLTDVYGDESTQKASVKVTKESGVEDIEVNAEDGAKYFTLQGIPIEKESLKAGIYIVIKDGRADRIVVR